MSFDFNSVKAKNINSIGALSHQELLIIGEDYITEGVSEISEIINERGITELKDHQIEIILNTITTILIDRCININIEREIKVCFN